MQYLHQVGLLTILPALVGPVLIPPAVDAELAFGRSLGIDLPNPAQLGWLTIRPPTPAFSISLPPGLHAGEAEVLALALEYGLNPTFVLPAAKWRVTG
jgi:predicted nucleic acid-binding protein